MSKVNGNGKVHSPVPGGAIPGGTIDTFIAEVPSLVHTDCAVLPDGRVLDLARDPDSPGGLQFIVWADGRGIRTHQLVVNGRKYVPPQLPQSVARVLRLPSSIGEPLPASALFGELQDHLHTYLEMPGDDAFLVAAWTICSWFADRLSVVPYLSIGGPYGSGKTTLLRLLHCLSRRGLHAGYITGASLYRLPGLIFPTLLLDESDPSRDKMSRDIERLLRNGNCRGADVYCNGEAFPTYGPKVLCSRLPLKDAALASRSLRITMKPAAKELALLHTEAEQKIAEDMQAKLLCFRLLHLRDFRLPSLKVEAFTPRMRDIATALAAPMFGDSQLEQRLLNCLQERDYLSRTERFGEAEWAVAVALYKESHTAFRDLYVGNIAASAQEMLVEYGDPGKLSAKEVGSILRNSLGFTTKRRGSGYRVQLTSETHRKIHETALAMGINRSDIINDQAVEAGYAGPPCSLCGEFGLMHDHDGSPLRAVLLPKSTRKKKRSGLFDGEEDK